MSGVHQAHRRYSFGIALELLNFNSRLDARLGLKRWRIDAIASVVITVWVFLPGLNLQSILQLLLI